MNANEHYVSQVLLRRFTINGHLQRYRLQFGDWKRISPKNVFSADGYNQLIVDGKVDHSLEQAFSKVETPFPKTLETLDAVANGTSTKVPLEIYDNLCWYSAFLKRISPYAKAAAPVDFVVQIDHELQAGRANTLREVLNFHESTIQLIQKRHEQGNRIIIDSEDFLQLVYRIQFRLGYARDFSMFRHNATWTVCTSSVELPVSDMGIVQQQVDAHKSVFYVLPIAPKRLLKAQIKWGSQNHSSETLIRGCELTPEESGYWHDAICLSAVTELVSKEKIRDVPAVRNRAKENGTRFVKIVDPSTVIGAGKKDFTSIFGLKFASSAEWVKFIHSFIQPFDT